MKSMKIWLAVLGVALAAGAQGQGWMKAFGGVIGQDIVPLSDGNIMLLASPSLKKLDMAGNLLFQKEMAGGRVGYELMPLPSGDFVVAGFEYVIRDYLEKMFKLAHVHVRSNFDLGL